MCSCVSLGVVLACGRWWLGSTATHSRPILQTLRSKNTVNLPLLALMTCTFKCFSPDWMFTRFCHLTVLPSFEVKLSPVTPFFYVDSDKLSIKIKATYVKTFFVHSGLFRKVTVRLNKVCFNLFHICCCCSDHAFQVVLFYFSVGLKHVSLLDTCLEKKCMGLAMSYLGL